MDQGYTGRSLTHSGKSCCIDKGLRSHLGGEAIAHSLVSSLSTPWGLWSRCMLHWSPEATVRETRHISVGMVAMDNWLVEHRLAAAEPQSCTGGAENSGPRPECTLWGHNLTRT